MKKRILGVFLSVILLVLTSCSPSSSTNKENEQLTIVTSFYPMYDFTKKVVGDQGNVSLLITGETEPHDYEPSAKDMAMIQDADLFIYHSNEMETWVAAVLDSIDTSKTTIVEASQGIELLTLTEAEEEEHEGHNHAHGVDPHLWLDPVLVQEEVKTIAKAIETVDPTNKALYQTNSEQFIEQLQTLDQAYQQQFSAATQRDFVTQHAAFGYLAARYDLHQLAISGISPDQEPTPAELAEIQDFVKANNVSIIYTEELSSSKIAKTIAEASGAEILTLNTLEGLSNAQQKKGEDYLSVMESNLEALGKAIN